MPVGEAFLSAFLQVLFDRLASREFIGLLHGRKYDDLLEKLKITLLTVTALLNDAEEKQFSSPSVGKWLHMAKDALYDAEDVLDELATEALKSKVEAQSQKNPNQVTNWRVISSPLSPFSRGIELKINKIIEKMEFIAKYKDILGLNDDVNGRLSRTKRRLPTTSLVDESCVYGRENDKGIIVKLLLIDDVNNNKVSVVPIVGMGGIGKTTLAQLVYNDNRVEEHFDLRIWVCVSDQFDVVRITTTILKSVTSKPTDLDDLNLLQVSLRKKIAGQKFLLVLDDVWGRRNNDWDLLWSPLKTGARGSKIIITTRDSNIAAGMGTVPAHNLECLSFEDCWSIFKNQAFEDRNIRNFPSLESIGAEIVKKCEGLPLAATRMGILLRSRQEEGEWYDMLNRKLWDLPDDESDILQTLGLSYHHLPPHLKQCFAYCSVFPADYEFDKDLLVLLWMAEGFVQQPNGQKKLEEVGGEYFRELVSRSFFRKSIHNSSLYVVHGLLKDLARFVSGDFCFRLEDKVIDGDQKRIFDKVRHSSYIRCRREMLTKFEAFSEVERLRTFLPLDPTGEIGVSYLPNKVPRDILPKLKYLRALSFSACRITALPDSIGDLKHLRYIDLSRTAIKQLPESTGTLYNLQTLILLECYSLRKLPADIGNLTSLRHLCISGSRLREMPLRMSKLKNLQTLSHFLVGKDKGSGIKDLKGMQELQGKLFISGLQNVISFTDAMEANLKDKRELTELVLQWSNDFDYSANDRDEEAVFNMAKVHRNRKDLNVSGCRNTRFPSFREATGVYRQETVESKLERRSSLYDSGNERVETDVLEMLQPHESVRQLTINDYGGTRFPGWIASPLFCNMKVMVLSSCQKCQFLPPLGQLPSLKNLTIEAMEGIKTIGTEFYGDGSLPILPFPSLEALKFDNMSEWEEWTSLGVEGTKDFLHLQSIEIQNCPKLKQISHQFPSLKKMTIYGCEKLEALPRVWKLDRLKQGSEFPCLLELSISMCPNLMELPVFFPSLKTLEIDECQKLAALPKLPSILELELNKCDGKVVESIFEHNSLTYMRICQISKLDCLVEGYFQHSTALKELQISHLGELTTLSNKVGLQNLLSLQLLEISGCPRLKELPEHLYKLSCLKVLKIWNCPSLVTFPEMGLPSTLVGLEIRSCEALQFLPERMMHESCKNKNTFLLEYLVVEGCSALISLPRDKLSSTLKELEIENCINLQSLPEQMICNSTLLESLKVAGCHSIKSFPESIFLLPKILSGTVMKLKEFVVSNCMNLEFLPEGLHNLSFLDHLEIADCPLLQSFPEPGLPTSMLRYIKISNCRSLKFLPDRIYMLAFLQELYIDGCPCLMSFPEGGLPSNIQSLSILDCENLKPSSGWGLHRLTYLADFSFGGCQGLVSFPEDWLLPTNLSSLYLERLPNLKSLPKGLKNLKYLETLEIWECDNLRTMPEEEPTTMLLSLWDAI
ncbi:Disease resistance protein [Melia azedarach]|uniref:Disease resistance protein n=1 Tax=Melia azedarach TaxID=155640 RepID=A0ACC1Y9P1_MELAZ|nr:Disease resistance protein [Melia azedarach]